MEKPTKIELKRRLGNTQEATILVEGKDDIVIYRWLADWAGFSSANILQCEGRETLREIYKERHLYPFVVLYITDQDMFIFSQIPQELLGMCFTAGYSIENDLFADGKDFLYRLLSSHELERKDELLKNLCQWFAFEVELFLEGQTTNNKFSDVKILNEGVIEKGKNYFTENFLKERNYKKPSEKLLNQISENYALQVRGKFLKCYKRFFKKALIKPFKTKTFGKSV